MSAAGVLTDKVIKMGNKRMYVGGREIRVYRRGWGVRDAAVI